MAIKLRESQVMMKALLKTQRTMDNRVEDNRQQTTDNRLVAMKVVTMVVVVTPTTPTTAKTEFFEAGHKALPHLLKKER